MLCHDPTLQRCFGMPGRVVDYDLAFLKTLRTLRAPHEPMPTLAELLDVLARPGSEHVWLLLDIKIDNDHEQVMRAIADTVAAHPGGFDKERVSLGCWTLDFLPVSACTETAGIKGETDESSVCDCCRTGVIPSAATILDHLSP